MAKAIQASLKRLALQPRLGSATSKPNVYRAPVKRYRIAIFYRTRRGQPGIQVVRIVRGTRVKNLNKIPRG